MNSHIDLLSSLDSTAKQRNIYYYSMFPWNKVKYIKIVNRESRNGNYCCIFFVLLKTVIMNKLFRRHDPLISETSSLLL